MQDIPRTSECRSCPARTGRASFPGRCALTGNRAGSGPLQHGCPPGIAPGKLREALLSVLGGDVRLVPADLPSGCSAAWLGGPGTDWIAHASDASAAAAVAHVAGHLILLHCGRVRDGGRFACTDARDDSRDLLYRIRAFVGDRELPAPLFTPEEERAADEVAADLLARCGYPASAPARRDLSTFGVFRCLG